MSDKFEKFIDFSQMQRREDERKAAQGEAIRLELRKGILPTPEPLVRALGWRMDRQSLLRDHSYAQEHKLREGLNALISSALSAHLDLSRAVAALTAFAQARESFEDHIHATVENPAQKEVLAFCNAYVGTIDTLRRFQKRRADIWPDLELLRQNHTSGVHYRFIFELRRNLSHGSVVVPYWSITSDEHSTSGSIQFSVEELQAFGSWGAEVKSFFVSQKKGSISILEIISQCAEGLAAFREDLNILFARYRTISEMDYHAIIDISNRSSGRNMNKMILRQVVANRVDPAAHLHRFFSEKETRRILEYVPHTPEQVEYVIRLCEAKYGVDAEMRSLLYQLFQVPVTIDVPVERPSFEPKPLGNDCPPPGLVAAFEAAQTTSPTGCIQGGDDDNSPNA